MATGTNYFLVTADGKQAGPYSLDQLREFWKTGLLTRTTPYWTVGMASWRPAGELEAVLSSLGRTPAYPPVPQTVLVAPTRQHSSGCGRALGICVSVVTACFGLLFVIAYIVGASLPQKPPPPWPPERVEFNRDLIAFRTPQDAIQFREDQQSFMLPLAMTRSGDALAQEAGWLNDQLRSKYIQSGSAAVVPQGVYRTVNFFDYSTGRSLSPSELHEATTIYAGFVVGDKTLYIEADVSAVQGAYLTGDTVNLNALSLMGY